ncbi:hypothetical protein V4F87_003286 [Vibrio parahaemolyticus]|nr:hypothetical protein [Vibrio parahaemolyticus]
MNKQQEKQLFEAVGKIIHNEKRKKLIAESSSYVIGTRLGSLLKSIDYDMTLYDDKCILTAENKNGLKMTVEMPKAIVSDYEVTQFLRKFAFL